MDSNRQFTDVIYDQFARIGRAVASPKRIELLDLLCQGPRSVEALAALTGLSEANASQHLKVLRGARLVEAEKMGVRVVYRLSGQEVADFIRSLRTLAEMRLAEVEQTVRIFLKGHQGFAGANREELLRRVRNGEVTVLDVRPIEEFRAGHLPQAISIPLEELNTRLGDLPKDREIVAYCRGPYCVLAIEAVESLKRAGFRAARLDLSIWDWKARGLPVETGSSLAQEEVRNAAY
ncbi:MAG: ArsR family transcriptional regulator [Pirellulales bacterium]|nr:ArsR family transcriptional regulator [Pirellulales bacterium]